MELKAKLIEVTEPQQMETKAGKTLIKALAIVETLGQYPKKIAITVMGEELISKVAALPLNSEVTMQINIESREYNGRWYSEVKLWKI